MNEQEMMEELKKTIETKTECMIGSYDKVLNNTAIMFDKYGSDISIDEVAKRADMFWNIALQRIDKEHQEAKIKHDQEKLMQQKAMQQSHVTSMPRDPNAPESPCAKKARESAEKIKALEAELQKDIDKAKK